ncbi:MAG TPA: HAD-IIIC family phosphatase [Polyangiaceae bacterium]|nr:HAD-IIIC family phosphatase [Polyangiaceae bacterium]
MGVPPVAERGRKNENPSELSFWELLKEDFVTHESSLFEQGFWAVANNRFGNWRMDVKNPLLRAPCTVAYRALEKGIEIFGGITLPYTTKLGRRVRLWHHGGMIIGARAIGNDVHIRQNTTIGVAQTWRDDDLPIIEDGADIGCGASILGPVVVGRNAKLGANAVVLEDIPEGATAMGNPAQVLFVAPTREPEAPPASKTEKKANGSMNGVTTLHAAPAAASLPVEPAQPEVAPAAEPEAAPRARVDLGTLALLGSANLDYLAMNFRETCRKYELGLALHVPPYGQAQRELIDAESELRKLQPSATLIVESAEHLLGELCADPLALQGEARQQALEERLGPWLRLIEMARDQLPGKLLVLSLGHVRRSVLAQADSESERGVKALIGEANRLLRGVVAELADTHVIDAEDVIAEVGRSRSDPGKYWHLGRVPFSTEFGDVLARRALGLLLSLAGKTTRVMVLDLDNTLWGGVLGEDGREGLKLGGAYPGSAFQEFQRTLRALARRGIALAVASKNDADQALDMMASHPEMILRPEDIVAHRISWNEKSQGIDEMLEELSLGKASCMFIDDNPVEREKVRRNLPEVVVPELPLDPAEFASWLLESPYLECQALTASDFKRTESYKARSAANASRRKFSNIDDFYRDLQMHVRFEPLGTDNRTRVLQLLVKTNQFNATTRRHDAAAIDALIQRGAEVYAIGAKDRYAGYELMGVIILEPLAERLHVDSFLLSCRILGRTLETAALGFACQRARARGASKLSAEIIETERNTPVRDVYKRHGFADLGGGRFELALEQAIQIPNYFTVDS